MKPVTESLIQKRILNYLNRQDWCVVWRNHNQGPKGTSGRMANQTKLGVSDIIGYFTKGIGMTGTAIFIEVKKPDGKISDDQKDFLAEAKKNGCEAFVARSLEDIKYWHNGLKNILER